MIIKTVIEAVVEGCLVTLVIYGFIHEKEVIDFEKKVWAKFRVRLSAKLRSCKRFMKWLYEPTVSEQIDADYKARPVRTYKYE